MGLDETTTPSFGPLRPGEVRHDCGGCHAHSLEPTPFEHTAAARPDYEVFDLTANVDITSNWKVGVHATNLFDDEHWETFGGSLVPRRALAHAMYTW